MSSVCMLNTKDPQAVLQQGRSKGGGDGKTLGIVAQDLKRHRHTDKGVGLDAPYPLARASGEAFKDDSAHHSHESSMGTLPNWMGCGRPSLRTSCTVNARQSRTCPPCPCHGPSFDSASQ
eukprot:3910537-Amphidinium_carterae.1